MYQRVTTTNKQDHACASSRTLPGRGQHVSSSRGIFSHRVALAETLRGSVPRQHQHHHHHSQSRQQPACRGAFPGSGLAATSAVESLQQQQSCCSITDDAARTESLIRTCVEEILCSSKWKRSMEIEEQKMQSKKRSLLVKCIKALGGDATAGSTSASPQQSPASNNVSHGEMICMPEAVAMLASMMGNVRHPR